MAEGIGPQRVGERAAPKIEWYRLSPARALQNLPPLRRQTMGPPIWRGYR